MLLVVSRIIVLLGAILALPILIGRHLVEGATGATFTSRLSALDALVVIYL